MSQSICGGAAPVRRVGDELGVAFWHMGHQPEWARADGGGEGELGGVHLVVLGDIAEDDEAQSGIPSWPGTRSGAGPARTRLFGRRSRPAAKLEDGGSPTFQRPHYVQGETDMPGPQGEASRSSFDEQTSPVAYNAA